VRDKEREGAPSCPHPRRHKAPGTQRYAGPTAVRKGNQPPERDSGRGHRQRRASVASADAEAMTAVQAAAVVQQVLVDGFTQTGAHCTSSGGANQCAQDQLTQRTGGRVGVSQGRHIPARTSRGNCTQTDRAGCDTGHEANGATGLAPPGEFGGLFALAARAFNSHGRRGGNEG